MQASLVQSIQFSPWSRVHTVSATTVSDTAPPAPIDWSFIFSFLVIIGMKAERMTEIAMMIIISSTSEKAFFIIRIP